MFHERPEGETFFDLGGQEYERQFNECVTCSHYFGCHSLDITELYRGSYSDATYSQGIRTAFERIMNLPRIASDNEARVLRVDNFCRTFFGESHAARLLDIGSGLAVFTARMNQLGWECSVVDPDPRAIKHAHEVSDAKGYCGTYEEVSADLPSNFRLITLNKVLEHVEDPVSLLVDIRNHLDEDGLLYVEVPDAPRALLKGGDREEFFIEHHHGFSPMSLLGSISRAGFLPLSLTSLAEPSGKFTLALFAHVEN